MTRSPRGRIHSPDPTGREPKRPARYGGLEAASLGMSSSRSWQAGSLVGAPAGLEVSNGGRAGRASQGYSKGRDRIAR